MNRRLTVLLAAGALAPALAAPVASAKTNVAVGIGDQNAAMFADANFKALKIKKVRYFIPWNAARNAAELNKADAYVAAARKAKARVFFHISTDDFTPKKAKLPSTSQYKREVGKLIKRYRAKGVKEWGVWNEANHKSQPTWDNPSRAAGFYRQMRTMCKGCTILALDVLDQAGDSRYISRWFAALPRSIRTSSSLRVGIHNYSDTNRKRSTGTSRIIKAVKQRNRRASFWLTETGGVANFGRAFPCDLKRQANRTAYMFTLAKKHRRDVDRLYAYSWSGGDCSSVFDAGLTDQNGKVRPAYSTFKSKAASFAR
ncbi:hypothetical protein [Conexibacter sp. SYSU D00693]|uniref:hypothetical protein n=1 Tax=Conexibacter sp. SYSU D00693 TaxID=2812560 RepID=UPI00196A85CC|nr:hypothetical protein [Conexibacter sp. SYSU D00693]